MVLRGGDSETSDLDYIPRGIRAPGPAGFQYRNYTNGPREPSYRLRKMRDWRDRRVQETN
ncbi:hypothetical protein BGX26_001007, partial [Mortierella sp. AD094]